jgi:DNA-binding NarL/FixJ family response regulator/succinate dehydrogenase/fumarate reductase flavoprotein subunit
MNSPRTSQHIRVLLADDHAVLRAGLRALLNAEPDIEVVGEAGDGYEAIHKVEILRPDIAVIDLSMPGMSGFETIEIITKQFPRTRTLVLTMYAEEQYILRTVDAGGSGYVLKSAADVELIKAIRQIDQGEPYFYAQAMQVLLEHSRQKNHEDSLNMLSDREYKVLVMTVQGYSSREIGETLYISPKTVDTYRQRVMEKLDVNHRADLFQYVLRTGLLERGDLLRDMVNGQMMESLAGLTYAAHAHFDHDVEWNHEVDVVVVGSGTGLMAALRAVDAGLSVIVLEKAATVGGTMAVSGGGIWVPNNYRMIEAGIADTEEEALEYLNHVSFGQYDLELARTFVEHCNDAIAFLRTIGIEWKFLPYFNDYYPHFPGGKVRGRSLEPIYDDVSINPGQYVSSYMEKAARDRGVEFLLETPARRLVIDEDQTVVGIIAETKDGRSLNIRSKRGVVLAAGGFDHNQAMTSNFLRGPLYFTRAVPTNTGDAHLMGMSLGAGLRHMNERWGSPVFFDPDQGASISALANELGKPGAIVVNKKGVRIMNEAAPYDAVTRAFYTFDTGKYEYVNIPSYVIIDSSHRKRYPLAMYPPTAELPHWIVQANSLVELAIALHIDAQALETTTKNFNRCARQGNDPEFNRGISDFDLTTGGDPSRTDLANFCLAPLEEPPFYGVPIWPSAIGTSGGLQINSSAQVLNVWQKVISGLYAVGNTAGSPIGGGYPGGGGTLSVGLVFAFLAAEHLIQTD